MPESISAELRGIRQSGRPFTSLRVRKDFERVFQQGRRFRCGPFTLVLREDPGFFRVGFKIGKKIGKAVVRNRLRRRFRACFETFVPAPGKGADIVVLASPAASQLSHRRMCKLMGKALTVAGFRGRLET